MSGYSTYLTTLIALDTKNLPRLQPGQYVELWAEDRKGGEGLVFVGRFVTKQNLTHTVERWKKNPAWRLKYQLGWLDRETESADYYLDMYR